MSCLSSRLRQHLLREKNLALELLQTFVRTTELSHHQASKMESFQQHDDSINAERRLLIDKKVTSNNRNGKTKWFRCGISRHLANNKICKARNATCNSYQKVDHFASECRSEHKNTKYYIDLSTSESDSEFANNITLKS